MEKKNIDWSNIGFGYMKTDKRYVSNFKNGAWDEGTLTSDDQITISECAGVLQYAQTCFEGMKAYTTEDGHIVTFRPDLNAARMADSAARLEMPVFPEDRFVDATCCNSECSLCTAIRIRSNIICKTIYVRFQCRYRCKTCRRISVPCICYTSWTILQRWSKTNYY